MRACLFCEKLRPNERKEVKVKRDSFIASEPFGGRSTETPRRGDGHSGCRAERGGSIFLCHRQILALMFCLVKDFVA